jgi:[NiFe] hydrogenase assembly HybE family chaperone
MAVKALVANPAAEVEAVFRRIDTERMADLPFRNPALRVEAVDFALHDDQWLGMLITPWAMSLMALPATAASWTSPPAGQRLMRRYPAGEFAFLGGNEDGIGEYLACSLFASMARFPDQETASLTARSCLSALTQQPAADTPPPAQPVASPSRRRFFMRGAG